MATKKHAKKTVKVTEGEEIAPGVIVGEPVSQKQALLMLYETLKSLNIRSISDLENLIARAD